MAPCRGRLQARLRPSVISFSVILAPLSVILDISNRGSSVVVFVFPLSVILAHARIQCRSLRKDRKKQRPWIPDRVGDDRREKTAPSMAPIRGASRRGCAPPSFLFLSSLRTRGSSIVLFAKTGRSKDLGSPIESGMTEGRKQRHPRWRQMPGRLQARLRRSPEFSLGARTV